MRDLDFLVPDDPALAWQEHALCASELPEAFVSPSATLQAAALAICARCPVREQCLDTAFANDERFGIWGGMTAEDRARVTGDTRPTTIKGVVDDLLRRLRG